jgi:hypothetical protein
LASPHPRDRPDAVTPFDNIEGTLEYVRLMADAIAEARAEIQEDLELARADEGAVRRLEALQIVSYKLDRLAQHTRASQRLLNDLRTLRRLLLGERAPEASGEQRAVMAAVAFREREG